MRIRFAPGDLAFYYNTNRSTVYAVRVESVAVVYKDDGPVINVAFQSQNAKQKPVGVVKEQNELFKTIQLAIKAMKKELDNTQ
jgi:hypothetical protein